MFCTRVSAMLLTASYLLNFAVAQAQQPFGIEVVDQATGRGVPLVELRTTDNRAYFTDSAGWVAIDDAALLDQEVFFSVSSHSYRFAADGFGLRGKRLRVVAGETARLEIERVNIAERHYRITGAGRYEHTVRLGKTAPIKHPLLQNQVTGSDSTFCVPYDGKLFWLWGDTNRLSYPLGNFSTTCATSRLPSDGGLPPDVGVELEYFGDRDGFVKKMAPFKSEGPVWLTGLLSLQDSDGKEHLVATYHKIRAPLKVYERGLCEFDAAEQVFREVLKFPADAKRIPEGHGFRHEDAGNRWVYVGEATPRVRFADRYEGWRDPATYEDVKPDAAFRDAEGKRIDAHHGHVEWSPHRQRWISIFTERGGDSSFLGEIWYAEAPRPEGPWRKAVKILTHDKVSFYNPTQHPYFSDATGRYLYFEGTYTMSFSGNEHPTPLYEYNQIMYRLDLDDPRLRAAHDE